MKKGSAPMHTPRRSRSLHAPLLTLAALVVTLGGPFFASSAQASSGSITVGLLGMDGANAPAAMGPAVTEALRRAIPKFAGVHIEMSQQDPAEVKLVFGCTDERPDCMAKVGKSLSVGRLIYGSLRKQQGSGVYTVTLKQLNVADGTVEKFITETVAVPLLTPGNPELDTLVEKWLRTLLIEGMRGGLQVQSSPPGATVLVDGAPVGITPTTVNDLEVGAHEVKLELAGHTTLARPVTIHAGLPYELTAQLQPQFLTAGRSAPASDSGNVSRGLRYTSYVFYGLAAVSALAAIGSWRTYVGSEDVANSRLDQLQRDLSSMHTLNTYRGFLGSSAQLSSCTPQPGLASNLSYQGYLSECQSGNSLANVATGLWITTAGLAAVGITTMIISAVLKRPEPKAASKNQNQPPKPTSEPVEITPPPARLQLDGVAPVVTPTGAGAVLSLRF